MRTSLRKEFGDQKPRAAVLDDNEGARRMTARKLKRLGFDVLQFGSVSDFVAEWLPGTVDVIIADWDLSAQEKGDHVLEQVRKKDWDVPFVLVSGKLEEDAARAKVLANLLESSGARFVKRGGGAKAASGITRVIEEAEDLIERRSLTLVRVILALRSDALKGTEIVTSSGKKPVAELLAEAVANTEASHDFERPVAVRVAEQRRPKKKK